MLQPLPGDRGRPGGRTSNTAGRGWGPYAAPCRARVHRAAGDAGEAGGDADPWPGGDSLRAAF